VAVWTSAVVVVTALHSSATLPYVEPMTSIQTSECWDV